MKAQAKLRAQLRNEDGSLKLTIDTSKIVEGRANGKLTPKQARIMQALDELDDTLRTNPGQRRLAFRKAVAAGVSMTAFRRDQKLRSKLWHRYSEQIISRLRRMLTPKDFDFGKDIHEAIDNIDNFDQQIDIDALREVGRECAQLSVRAKDLATKIAQAVEAREKVINPSLAALLAPEEDAA
jgi:hypothetical protein